MSRLTASKNKVIKLTKPKSKNKVITTYKPRNAIETQGQIDRLTELKSKLEYEKEEMEEGEALEIGSLERPPNPSDEATELELSSYHKDLKRYENELEIIQSKYRKKAAVVDKGLAAVNMDLTTRNYYILKTLMANAEEQMQNKENILRLEYLKKKLSELSYEEYDEEDTSMIREQAYNLSNLVNTSIDTNKNIAIFKKMLTETKDIPGDVLTKAAEVVKSIEKIPKTNQIIEYLNMAVQKADENTAIKRVARMKASIVDKFVLSEPATEEQRTEFKKNVLILDSLSKNKYKFKLVRDIMMRLTNSTIFPGVSEKTADTTIVSKFQKATAIRQLQLSRLWVQFLDKPMVLEEKTIEEMKKNLSGIVEKSEKALSGTTKQEKQKITEKIITGIDDEEERTGESEVIIMGKGSRDYDDDEYGGDLFHAIRTFGLSGVVPKKVSDFLKQWGGLRIGEVKILKNAIDANVNKLLNLVTEGRIEKGKQAINTDALFHLYLRLSCYDEYGGLKYVLVEKNNVFNIEFSERPGEYTMVAGNLDKLITINEFINRAQAEHQAHGIDLYKYDPINANCQIFVDLALDGAKINSQDAKNFTIQDVARIFDLVSANQTAFIRGAVSVGAFFQALME